MRDPPGGKSARECGRGLNCDRPSHCHKGLSGARRRMAETASQGGAPRVPPNDKPVWKPCSGSAAMCPELEHGHFCHEKKCKGGVGAKQVMKEHLEEENVTLVDQPASEPMIRIACDGWAVGEHGLLEPVPAEGKVKEIETPKSKGVKTVPSAPTAERKYQSSPIGPGRSPSDEGDKGKAEGEKKLNESNLVPPDANTRVNSKLGTTTRASALVVKPKNKGYCSDDNFNPIPPELVDEQQLVWLYVNGGPNITAEYWWQRLYDAIARNVWRIPGLSRDQFFATNFPSKHDGQQLAATPEFIRDETLERITSSATTKTRFKWWSHGRGFKTGTRHGRATPLLEHFGRKVHAKVFTALYAVLFQDRRLCQRMVIDGNGEFVDSLIQATIAAVGRHPDRNVWLADPVAFYNTISYYAQQQMTNHLMLKTSKASGPASSVFRLTGVRK